MSSLTFIGFELLRWWLQIHLPSYPSSIVFFFFFFNKGWNYWIVVFIFIFINTSLTKQFIYYLEIDKLLLLHWWTLFFFKKKRPPMVTPQIGNQNPPCWEKLINMFSTHEENMAASNNKEGLHHRTTFLSTTDYSRRPNIHIEWDV